MTPPNRDHLVPMMVPGKDGKPVLRYVNPERGESYSERMDKMRQEVISRPRTNIPPGAKPYVEMSKEYAQMGRRRTALSWAIDDVKSTVRSQNLGTTTDEEWGKVKVGNPAKLFDADTAAKGMNKEEFLECSKEVYLNTILSDRFPDVYENCSEPDEDRPIVNIYVRQDGAKPNGEPIQIDYSRDGSLEDQIRTLDRLVDEYDDLGSRREDIRSQIVDEFDTGITDLGDAVIEYTHHRNVDWDQAATELGGNIEACRSRKVISTKVKQVMGDDFYQSCRTGSREAPLSYELY